MANFDWDHYLPIITTCLVVNETYTLLNFRSKGHKELLATLDMLFWGEENFFRIMYLTEADYPKIAKILNQYTSPKKVLSFVDASIIYLSQIFKCKEIVSFDSHFDGILTRIFSM